MSFPNAGGSWNTGFTCANCGVFVANGTYHTCTYRYITPVYPTYPTYPMYIYTPSPNDAILERIEKLLEEMLEVLKKI